MPQECPPYKTMGTRTLTSVFAPGTFAQSPFDQVSHIAATFAFGSFALGTFGIGVNNPLVLKFNTVSLS
jgi:hypothetical protein